MFGAMNPAASAWTATRLVIWCRATLGQTSATCSTRQGTKEQSQPSTKSTRRRALTLAFNDRRPTTARGHDDEHEDQKDRNDTPIPIQIGLAHQSPPPSLMSMFTSSVPLGC